MTHIIIPNESGLNFPSGGGDPDEILYISNVANIPTSDPDFTRDEVTHYTRIAATVDTGKTVEWEISNAVGTGGAVKGFALGYQFDAGPPAQNLYLLAGNIGGTEAVQLIYENGTKEHGVLVTANDAGLYVNNSGGIDVLLTLFDPGGVKIAGKDTGTDYALRVYDGNIVDFGGTELFAVRNNKYTFVRDNLYVGNAFSSGTPTAGIISGTEGSGANIAGGTLALTGGAGTGLGIGGHTTIGCAPAGGAGSSLNATVPLAYFWGDGKGISVYTRVDPTTDQTDAFTFFSKDIAAGNAAPHFRTENGNIVKLFRGAAVADASGGAIIDAEARTAINTLLARMRVTGGNGQIAD